jgi:hypothetical protein
VPVQEKMPAGFAVPLWSLALLVDWATLHHAFRQQVADLTIFFLPVAFLALAPLAFGWMRRFDRVKPYHCGEREPFDAALFYYAPGAAARRAIYGFFTLLFAAVALTGVLS